MSVTRPRLVALLPMKAHSERVPGKNFREFEGKPLFHWVLDTLLAIEAIELVVINTDAGQILGNYPLGDSGRVVIRNRKPELCGDLVSMNRVIGDDVAEVPADIYLMTHATNPLMSAKTIRRALDEFQKAHASRQADSLFTVNRVQTRFYRDDGSAVNHDPDNLMRSQDLEPWFAENSNLYLFTRDSFNATHARIGRRPLIFESPRLESIDIDDPEDWEFAVIAARYLRSQGAMRIRGQGA